jgi:hypothetical protein
MANIDVTALGVQTIALRDLCVTLEAGHEIIAAANDLVDGVTALTDVVAGVATTRPFPIRFLFVPEVVKPVAPKV